MIIPTYIDMNKRECLASIENVKKQLDELNIILRNSTGEEKKELQQVQLDLLGILEIAVQELEAQSSKTIDKSCTKFDDEFEIFKAEIEKVTSEQDHNNSNLTEEAAVSESLKNDLLALEGTEVQAPFIERWGGYSYHNAVILSIVLPEDDSQFIEPKALVLYSQPTCDAMIPCTFFLSDKCVFNKEQCKYSHGNEVSVASLKDYIAPKTINIQKGSLIISKHFGELWHRGVIYDELIDRTSFSVDCEVCKKIVEVKPEDIITISQSEEPKIKSKIRLLEANASTSPTEESIQLLKPNLDFGEWEKHTKGIGSKIMEKMGYLNGTGLGKQSDGRLDPVTTLVYPQGVSLDRCMELRMAGEGKCLLEVEKHLQKVQKKHEAKMKIYEDNVTKDNVFQIINSKLAEKSGETSKSSNRAIDVGKISLTKNTIKDLNKKNLEIGTSIQSLSSEIRKLEDSKKRHVNDKNMLNVIEDKLKNRRNAMKKFELAEMAVRREQTNRKDAKKMTIF